MSATKKVKEINVVVVGVSGAETIKGPAGVGKSLLCNRFVRPAADEFHREHCSVLSQIDFCGSPVINKDHWLYWGDRSFECSESSSVLVRVVEQTEFLDDETFETIAGCSKSDEYCQRCSRTSLHSRDKLMYIQKEQLGLESEFPQHLLPDGKFPVDGFVIVCDVSKNGVKQSATLLKIAKSVAKTKKPAVVAFTKCDELSEECRKLYINMFAATKELKNVLLPPVETSSVKNVNVECVFHCLVNMCFRAYRYTKKPLPYYEAVHYVEQKNLHIKCSFSSLLSQAVPLTSWQRNGLSWKHILADIDRHPDLKNFVAVFGSRVAFEMYERYVSEAKELWALNKLRSQVPRLFDVFKMFLDAGELVEMDWYTAKEAIQSHELFDAIFGSIDYDYDFWSPDGQTSAKRLPAEILLLPEAIKAFDQFKMSSLKTQQNRQLAEDFEYFLNNLNQIPPGTSFKEAYHHFQDFSVFRKLSDSAAVEVYSKFQTRLIQKSDDRLVECLLENLHNILNSCGDAHFHEFSSKHQIEIVKNCVEDDERFEWMSRIPEIRDSVIFRFIPFILNPSPTNCPASSACVDGLPVLNRFFQHLGSDDSRTKRCAKVQISTTCGDRVCLDFLSTVILQNESIEPVHLNSEGSITLEILNREQTSWNRLELAISSYHRLTDPADGYVLFYDTRRKASFVNARCAIDNIAEANLTNFSSILVLAVVDESSFQSENLTEGAELCKSIGARFQVIDTRQTAELNAELMELFHDITEHGSDKVPNERPTTLATSGIQILSKPDRSRRPSARNRVNRTDPNIISRFYSSQQSDVQPAPLATPEAVDFSPAYSMVNDAVGTIIQVNGISCHKDKYDSLETSLGSRSDSSSMSGYNSGPRSSSEVTRRSRTSCVSLSSDSINKLHRTSNLFTLAPSIPSTSSMRKSQSTESLTKLPEKEKPEKGGYRFVRKVATSFRLRKSLMDVDAEAKKAEKSRSTTSPEQISSFLEKMATRSLPQSPRTDRKAKLYSSINSTTEKVSNVLSWLPSKTSKRMMKNKSATHDLSSSIHSASTSSNGVIVGDQNLKLLCAASQSRIPVFVEKCVEYIENNGGFEQEGLYRVPGNQTHLVELEKRFLQTSTFDVSSFDSPLHVAATALKNFFSCLPDSLIPAANHSKFKQLVIIGDEAEKLRLLRESLTVLPEHNQQVLRYLVRHLSRVAESPKTVMNANNLSKVWSPTLFRPVFVSYEELSSGMIAYQLALESLINNADSLYLRDTV